MPDRNWLEQVVKRAVSEVLEGHLARIQSELVERVLGEVEPRLGGSPEGNPASLLKAVSSVHSGMTQREILRNFLDGAAEHTGRVALFVIKAGTATGWQARGFADSERIKDFSLAVGNGLAAQALGSRTAATGRAEQVDPQFLSQFQSPADGAVILLPLVLKEKVAALVYADAGASAGGRMDVAALELLVVTTSAWLEVVASRKHSAKENPGEVAGQEIHGHEKAAHSQAISDPFAAHPPAHSPAPKAPVEAHVAVAQSSAPVVGQAEPSHFSGSAAGTAVGLAPETVASSSPEEAEVHGKAQRFARLLVDEIKLYNQTKVTEGRKNRDLYDRLKEDIDKSFATYQKRYGNTVAASGGYFNAELVRNLAEDDISLLGTNFQR